MVHVATELAWKLEKAIISEEISFLSFSNQHWTSEINRRTRRNRSWGLCEFRFNNLAGGIEEMTEIKKLFIELRQKWKDLFEMNIGYVMTLGLHDDIEAIMEKILIG